MTSADARLADSFDRYLDELAAVGRRPAPVWPAEIEALLAQAALRLHDQDEAPGADRAFADQLWRDLIATAEPAGTVLPPRRAGVTAATPDHAASGPDTVRPSRLVWIRSGWAMAQLATAALLLLTLASSFFLFGPGRAGVHEVSRRVFIPAAPEAPAGPAPAAEVVWESRGGPDLPFHNPGRVTVDPDGNLWVVDGQRDGFQIFSPNGEFIDFWEGDGQFDLSDKVHAWSYGAAAFDDDGILYVADAGNKRVQKFAPDRTLLGAWGSEGRQDGQFLRPDSLAVDDQGRVYVLDSERSDIQVFDADGKYLRTIGEYGLREGQFFVRAQGGLTVDTAGNVWIADIGNQRVQKFSPEGDFLIAFGGYGFGEGKFASPSGVAIDRDGRVFVLDVAKTGNRVQVFSPEGQYLAVWSEAAGRPAQDSTGAGLVLDGKGNAYISDIDDSRVQKLRLLPPFAPAKVDAEIVAENVDSPVAELIWQTSGSSDQPLDHPSGLTIDPAGNLWVSDTYHSQYQIFSPEGELLEIWGQTGSDAGEFDFVQKAGATRLGYAGGTPVGGVAFTVDGGFYVADTNNHRVQKFGPDREYLLAWGSEGTGDGQFIWPSDVAVDDEGRVYVTDLERSDVQVFDGDGTYLHTIGEFGFDDGQLYLYTAGFVEVDSTGTIWVTDSGSNRIQAFSAEGEFLAKVGGPGQGGGRLGTAAQVAIDDMGRLFVTDWTSKLVQVFAADGEFLGAWGGEGLGPTYGPVGIALDGLGNVYISDTDDNRIMKFRLLSPLAPS